MSNYNYVDDVVIDVDIATEYMNLNFELLYSSMQFITPNIKILPHNYSPIIAILHNVLSQNWI